MTGRSEIDRVCGVVCEDVKFVKAKSGKRYRIAPTARTEGRRYEVGEHVSFFRQKVGGKMVARDVRQIHTKPVKVPSAEKYRRLK